MKYLSDLKINGNLEFLNTSPEIKISNGSVKIPIKSGALLVESDVSNFISNETLTANYYDKNVLDGKINCTSGKILAGTISTCTITGHDIYTQILNVCTITGCIINTCTLNACDVGGCNIHACCVDAYELNTNKITSKDTNTIEIGSKDESVNIEGVTVFSSVPTVKIDGGYINVITESSLNSELSSYVPTLRTVNSKSLSSNITLYGSDIKVSSTLGSCTIAGCINSLASNKADKATTLSGYCITDGVTTSTFDTLVSRVAVNEGDITALETCLSNVYTKSESDNKYIDFTSDQIINGTKTFTNVVINNLNASSLTLDELTIEGETGFSGDAVFSGCVKLNGTTTAKTASAGTNNTQVATTAFVTRAVTTSANSLSNTISALEGRVSTAENKLTTVYSYKGSVATISALNAITTKSNGDVYNVAEDGMNHAWVSNSSEAGGGHWDSLGEIVDLSGYALKSEIVTITGDQVISGDKEFTGNLTVSTLSTTNLELLNLSVTDSVTYDVLPQYTGNAGPIAPADLTTKSYVDSIVPVTKVYTSPALNPSNGEVTWTVTLEDTYDNPPFLQLYKSDGTVVLSTMQYTGTTIVVPMSMYSPTTAGAFNLHVSGTINSATPSQRVVTRAEYDALTSIASNTIYFITD